MIQTLSEVELAQFWLIYFSVTWPQTTSIQVAKSKIAAGRYEVESLLARRRVETHPAIRVFVFEKQHGWRWGTCRRAWAGAAWSSWFLKGFSASANLGPSQASVIRMAQQADKHEKQKKWTFMMRDWAKFTARKDRECREETVYLLQLGIKLWYVCAMNINDTFVIKITDFVHNFAENLVCFGCVTFFIIFLWLIVLKRLVYPETHTILSLVTHLHVTPNSLKLLFIFETKN